MIVTVTFANKGLSNAIKCYIFAFNVILYCTQNFAEAVNQTLSPKWSFFSNVVSEGLIRSSNSVHLKWSHLLNYCSLVMNNTV